MLSKVFTSYTYGTEASLLEVEADVSGGLPCFNIVGLPDEALRESRDRVRAAIKNSGYDFPVSRITINLAPAYIRKEGSCFDLPIALGILASSGQIPLEPLGRFMFLGELSLNGMIKPIKGVLAIAMFLKKLSAVNNMIIPPENAFEAALIDGISVYKARDLKQAVNILSNSSDIEPVKSDVDKLGKNNDYGLDFSEVKGQYFAKRALEVAACGFHNIIMSGPAGSGKTMLARRLPTIMPSMSKEEIFEVTKIYSVRGLLSIDDPLISKRPFRSVHHSASGIALVGGGQEPKPGEVSLAHNGVLFLDELLEFRRDALESLREPLEEGRITVARANNTLTFLSRFLLVCAMNPCPCGNFGNPNIACTCTSSKIAHYRGKISGPLLDRIDICIDVPALQFSELVKNRQSESSSEIRRRVENARSIQLKRFKDEGIFHNAQMSAKMINKYCYLEKDAEGLLKIAVSELALSGRAYDKILKVSRTIADLAGAGVISSEHISEAVQYRRMEKR